MDYSPTDFIHYSIQCLIHDKIYDYISVEVHPSENAIIINFSLQIVIISNLSEYLTSDIKIIQKIVNLCRIRTCSDINLLAKYIFNNFSSILNEAAVTDLIQILTYLRDRKQIFPMKYLYPDPFKHLDEFSSTYFAFDSPKLSNLSDYISLLYEGFEEKIEGTSLILKLARQPDNLYSLLENDVLLSALARVLRDDWKKSLTTPINILYFFFCLSTFSSFHYIILKHRIGSFCIQLIEHETSNHSNEESALFLDVQKCNTLESIDLNDSHSRGQLLRLTLYLLLNISENEKIEIKILNNGLIALIFKLLKIKNEELIILSISLLKKFSIFSENIRKIHQLNFVGNFCRFLLSPSKIIQFLTLRLYLNLSFDPDIQLSLSTDEFLLNIFNLARIVDFKYVVLCILYHISVRSRCIPLFLHQDSILFFRQCLQESENDFIDPEILCLLINLVENIDFSVKFFNDEILHYIISRALSLQDALLLRIIRTAVQNQFYSPILNRYFDYFIQFFQSFENNDMLIEILGLLNSILQVLQHDSEIIRRIIDMKISLFIMDKILLTIDSEDDLLIELFSLFVQILLMDNAFLKFKEVEILDVFLKILELKQRDEEIVLRILYIIYIILFDCAPANITSPNHVSNILLHFIEPLSSRNTLFCHHCLDLYIGQKCLQSSRILKRKFRQHNFRWFELFNETMIFHYDDHSSCNKVLAFDNFPIPNFSNYCENFTYTFAGDNILFL